MKEIPKELYLLHAVIESYIIWLASPLPRYLFYRSFFFYNQKSVLPFVFTSRRKWRRWNVKRSAKITGDVHVGLSSSDVYSIVALFELESWGLLFFYLEEIKYWTCIFAKDVALKLLCTFGVFICAFSRVVFANRAPVSTSSGVVQKT